jgi:hypothetical protein
MTMNAKIGYSSSPGSLLLCPFADFVLTLHRKGLRAVAQIQPPAPLLAYYSAKMTITLDKAD